MAELTARIGLDSREFVKGINDCKAVIQEFKNTEESAMKAIDDFKGVTNKQISALNRSVRAIDSAIDGTKNFKQQLSILRSEEEKMIQQFNNLPDEVKVGKIGNAYKSMFDMLHSRIGSLESKIKDASSSSKSFGEALKNAINDKIPGAGTLASELGKYGPLLAAAALGAKELISAFMSVESNADSVRESIQGWKTAWDDFKHSAAAGVSFSITGSYKNGKESYTANDYKDSVFSNEKVAYNKKKRLYKEAQQEYEDAKTSGDSAAISAAKAKMKAADAAVSAIEDKMISAAEEAAKKDFKAISGSFAKEETIEAIRQLYEETGQSVMDLGSEAKKELDKINEEYNLKVGPLKKLQNSGSGSIANEREIHKYEAEFGRRRDALYKKYGGSESFSVLINLQNKESSEKLASYVANTVLADDIRSARADRKRELAPKLKGESSNGSSSKSSSKSTNDPYPEGSIGWHEQRLTELNEKFKRSSDEAEMKSLKDEIDSEKAIIEKLKGDIEKSKSKLQLIEEAISEQSELLTDVVDISSMTEDEKSAYLSKRAEGIENLRKLRIAKAAQSFNVDVAGLDTTSKAYYSRAATYSKDMYDLTPESDTKERKNWQFQSLLSKYKADGAKGMSEDDLTTFKKLLEELFESQKDSNSKYAIGVKENIPAWLEDVNNTLKSKNKKPNSDSSKKEFQDIKKRAAAVQSLADAWGNVAKAIGSSDPGAILTAMSSGIQKTADTMLEFADLLHSLSVKKKADNMSEIATEEGKTLASGSASAAKLPFPYNIAAIASVVATVIGIFGTIWSVAKTAKFANGGIVGGSSYTGDRVHAMVNSGEMILNQQQQANLFSLANGRGSANTSNIRVTGEIVADGRNLKCIIKNQDRFESRR